MTLKNNITTLKNFIGMRQMTLNDPKFHAKTSIVHGMHPRPAWRVIGVGGGGGGIKSLEKTLLRGGVINFYFGGGEGGSCNFEVKIKIALIPV